MISQYFMGDMMPDRAIHIQRCKQFRCAPHVIRAGRNKAAGKFSKLRAFAPFIATRPHGKMRSATHARYSPTEIQVLNHGWNVVEIVPPEDKRGLV